MGRYGVERRVGAGQVGPQGKLLRGPRTCRRLASMKHNLLVGVVFLAAASGCGMTPHESTFPVRYVEQKPLYSTAEDCVAYGTFSVTDARQERTAVGKRQYQGHPERLDPISMTGDLTGAVSAAIQKGFDVAVVRHNDASPMSIKFELVKFTLDEHTDFGSDYAATLVIDVQVLDRRNQAAVWKSRKTGHGENHGNPDSTENYQETVSRSIEDLLVQLLEDAEFGRALCGVAAPGHPPAPPAPVSS